MSRLSSRAHPVCIAIACMLLVLSSAVAPAHARRAGGQSSADLLLSTYYNIINVGMKSGNFSALASVLTPDTTLTVSNPLGKTEVYQGLKAAIAYYHESFLHVPGLYFKPVIVHDVSLTVLFTYDVAENTKHTVVGKCAHLFIIRNGRFSSHDYITYYTGQG